MLAASGLGAARLAAAAGAPASGGGGDSFERSQLVGARRSSGHPRRRVSAHRTWRRWRWRHHNGLITDATARGRVLARRIASGQPRGGLCGQHLIESMRRHRLQRSRVGGGAHPCEGVVHHFIEQPGLERIQGVRFGRHLRRHAVREAAHRRKEQIVAHRGNDVLAHLLLSLFRRAALLHRAATLAGLAAP